MAKQTESPRALIKQRRLDSVSAAVQESRKMRISYVCFALFLCGALLLPVQAFHSEKPFRAAVPSPVIVKDLFKTSLSSTADPPASQASPSTSSNDPEAFLSEDELPQPDMSSIVPTHRTLYDVLGASPTDSREVLKQKYVVLAKQSHPDALRSGESNATKSIDFTEVAAAWNILSDSKQRKRYDRSLQAEQFSQEVQDWAGDLGRKAAPAARAFGEVALPFLRRTTAATLASIQAAANDLTRKEKEKETKADLSTTFQSAMKAAKRAGRYVDSLELFEKSEALHARAVRESEMATQIQKELDEIAAKRLQMALHTPGSGLTSAEAMVVWEDFNSTVGDMLTVWDRAMMKHTIEYEIQELQQAEMAFVETQQDDTQAQKEYQMSLQSKLKAKLEVIEAEEAEEEARRALSEAEQRALKARATLDDATHGLAQTEAQTRKSDFEMERKSLSLVKQSEKVRNALRVKEKEVLKHKGVEDGPLEDEVSAERLAELKELRREERLLTQSRARMETIAARLFSRASKLRERAEELEKLE